MIQAGICVYTTQVRPRIQLCQLGNGHSELSPDLVVVKSERSILSLIRGDYCLSQTYRGLPSSADVLEVVLILIIIRAADGH